MIRKNALPMGLAIALFGLPVVAGELDAFVVARDGAITCWSRTYDQKHLAQHPQQTVTDMQFAVGYVGDRAEYSAMYWFELHATQRGEVSGVTSGTCWPEGEGMRCGVDCDGGGVVVSTRNDGRVLLDLADYGYIRMFSECAAGDEEASYSLESGIDDKAFLLAEVSGAQCKAMRPDWLD